MFDKPTRFTVTAGKGESDVSALNAIDNAMIDADIGDLNLVKVSSVLPEDIKEVEEVNLSIGKFVPCVIAESVAVKNEIAAGIAYGSRVDEKGGYVIEHSACKNKIDIDEFEKKMKLKLNEMGVIRGVSFKNIKAVHSHLDIKKKFGCAIAALVYLP